MEHRLRSPSRTYSDMPDVRRAQGSDRNHTRHSSPSTRSHVEAESSVYAEARKNGIFLPSSEYIAELLLGRDSPVAVVDSDSESERARAPTPVVEAPPPQPPTPPTTASTATNTATTSTASTANTAAASRQSDNPTPGTSRGPTCRREGLRQRTPKVNTQQQTPVARPSTSRTTRRSKRKPSASAKDAPAETSGAATADPQNKDAIEIIFVEDSDSDSQSSAESSRIRSFFKDSRLPYSAIEDEEILKFVLIGNNVEKTSSILLWKELEAIKGNPKRTYQSLKNRFLRNIKPHILTRFQHLLTPENLKMLKKKFPDMDFPDKKKYAPVRPQGFVNPSVGAQWPPATATLSTPICVPSTSNADVIVMDNDQEIRERPSTSFEPVNLPGPEPKNTAGDGGAMEGNKQLTDSRANDAPNVPNVPNTPNETNIVWQENVLANQLERVVNIFAKEKLINVPVQSFKYYHTMGTFANTAAINLKLILDRSGVTGLPADVPINVNVTVTVGKQQGKKPVQKRGSVPVKDRDNLRAKNKDKMKNKKDLKKGSKKGLQRGYILEIKDEYKRKHNSSSKKWCVAAADSMLYKTELEKLMEDMRNEAAGGGHADAEFTVNDFVPDNYSQYTNCSTEDESCYTQTLKKVSHIYKVEVKPTQSLIEDDSEDFSVFTTQTPPVADKGTAVADAVLTPKGSTPPGL